MATVNQCFFGRVVDIAGSVYHLTRALSLVNETLDTPEALSDANIAVVNFMVVHELLRGAKSTALVHLKGLERMVQLRGGISALESDTMLMLKICK